MSENSKSVRANVWSEQEAVPLDLERIRRVAEATLDAEGSPLRVSVTFVDDQRIRELNEQYLDIPEPTDVLAFPLYQDGDPDECLGEVVISAERAVEEAKLRGIPWERELLLYVIHGILHLLGYDDIEGDAKARMEARQEELLARLITSELR